MWSDTESRLHINFLELKAVFLALKSFRASLHAGSDCIGSNGQHDCGVLYQLGGRYEIRLTLCPPLEASIMVPSQENSPKGKSHSRFLNVITDKLSRHNQIIQTEWSLSQQVFNLLCSRWARPQLYLFATQFNHKLPSVVSPVPDQKAGQ